jgi:hypothetical protein
MYPRHAERWANGAEALDRHTEGVEYTAHTAYTAYTDMDEGVPFGIYRRDKMIRKRKSPHLLAGCERALFPVYAGSLAMTLTQDARNSNHPDGEDFVFAGFSAPVYTQVPDAVFDELLPVLSGAELKVLLYVIRRTFGFKKAADDISINQIMHGITTREGEILDRGTGLSKDAVTRATRRLVEVGVLIARRNRSRERGNEATTYALHLRDPLSENRTRASPKIGQGLVRFSDTQDTEVQETVRQEGFEVSKAPPAVDKSVDNHGDIPTAYAGAQSPPLVTLITDFSREMGDTNHLGANITQAHRIFTDSGTDLDAFFAILYEARLRTRKTNGVGNRMAYFFTVLCDLASGAAT